MKWDVTVQEATQIQKELRAQIKTVPLERAPRTIAGADISHNRFSNDLFAVAVVFSYPSLEIVEVGKAAGKTTFPYRSGYLSFREIPLLLEAFGQLQRMPDVIMADGQGIAHPRRMGLAAHLGLALAVPAFGCAKSRLYGEGEEPGEARGDIALLRARRRRGRRRLRADEGAHRARRRLAGAPHHAR
jgi:deoxyribonuclease V